VGEKNHGDFYQSSSAMAKEKGLKKFAEGRHIVTGQ